MEEFLAANPSSDVRRSRIRLQDLAKGLEHGITRVVAIGIVDVLEVIQVDQHHPEREAVPYRSRQLMGGPRIDRATIGQAGQRIRQRRLLQQAVLFLELTVQVDQAPADVDTRHQLFDVKRFGQIVVGAGGEPFDDVVFRGDAGHHVIDEVVQGSVAFPRIERAALGRPLGFLAQTPVGLGFGAAVLGLGDLLHVRVILSQHARRADRAGGNYRINERSRALV